MKLFIVSAPSGAGKTTLCNRLVSELHRELKLSVSCTTRKPRPGEKAGVDYYFLTEHEFKERVKKGDFAEWATVHGHLYGTSKSAIENSLTKGLSLLLEIDVQGAQALKQIYPKDCVLIFIAPPSIEALEKRLRSRGTDSEQTIQKRVENARTEMERSHLFDRIVINDDLERAYMDLKYFVTAQLRKGT